MVQQDFNKTNREAIFQHGSHGEFKLDSERLYRIVAQITIAKSVQERVLAV